MSTRTRARDPGATSMNLTPLLDVVLQLITFFMMLIHFGSKLEGAEDAVRLPVAPSALPGSDLALDRLAVSVDAKGRLLDGGKPLEEDAVKGWWLVQAQARRAGQKALAGNGGGPIVEELPTQVVLRTDKDAPYGSVRRMLLTAQEAGFARFSLVVLRSKPR